MKHFYSIGRMMLELFLLCILAAPLAIGQARLPSVVYIGHGYNAFEGNPNSILMDPGYTVSIFSLTYNNVSNIFNPLHTDPAIIALSFKQMVISVQLKELS